MPPRPVGLRLRSLFAGVVLCAAAALGALAQDSGAAEPVDLRRLKFEYKCYFGVKEWEGKGEEEFLARLEGQRALYESALPAQLEALEDLLADALWKRAGFYKARNDLRTASDLADKILGLTSEKGRVAELKPEADDLVVSYKFEEAKKLEQEGNPAAAYREYLGCLRTRNAQVRAQSLGGVVRLTPAAQPYEQVKASGDLMAELNCVQGIIEELKQAIPATAFDLDHPDIRRLTDREEWLREHLGLVRVTVLDVSGALAGYRGGSKPLDLETATFSFTPLGGQKAWPEGGGSRTLPRPDRPHAVDKGTYDIRVYLPAAGADPVAVFVNVVAGAQPAPVEVPGTIPDGMVYVGPWQGGGGFFIDRYEVTVAQVSAGSGGNEVLDLVVSDSAGVPPDTPAWFYPPEDAGEAQPARVWEQVSGKKIPTVEQWLQAAFGPYSPQERPYPWGTEAPVPGKHFYTAKVEVPCPVGRMPAGASPFGVQDMVGNVAEWVVKDGGLWVLGGHYLLDSDALFGSGGGLSWIREPAPGPEAFKGVDQDKYGSHRIDKEAGYYVGLRMVIPVAQ